MPKLTKSQKLWKERASALKRLNVGIGVEPQKIKREWYKWRDIAMFPERYKKISVEKFRREEVKALSATGYKIADNKAFISLSGYQNASIAHSVYKTPNGPYDRLEINRTIRSSGKVVKKQTEYVGTRMQRMEWRERLMAEYQAGGFKPGETLMAKVYDRGAMRGSRQTSLASLIKYIEEIKWQTPGNHIDNVHIVRVWSAGNEYALEKREATKRQESKRSGQVRSKYGDKKRKTGGK